MSQKGILAQNSIILNPKGHSWIKRTLVARKGHLLRIILMTVSDRRPSMWLKSFVWKFPLMTCVIKYVRTDHPPTVSLRMFDEIKVTINNMFIIIPPVQITILFNHGRKCTVSFCPPPHLETQLTKPSHGLVLARRETATASVMKAAWRHFTTFFSSLREIFETWPLVSTRGIPLKNA